MKCSSKSLYALRTYFFKHFSLATSRDIRLTVTKFITVEYAGTTRTHQIYIYVYTICHASVFAKDNYKSVCQISHDLQQSTDNKQFYYILKCPP